MVDSHTGPEPSKEAVELAFRALFTSDPNLSLEANAQLAANRLNGGAELRAEAIAALANGPNDARTLRAIELLGVPSSEGA